MLSRINITANGRIDLGLLCEALIFYDYVIVSLSQGTLERLIRFFGLDNLEYLIKQGALELSVDLQPVGAGRMPNGKYIAGKFMSDDWNKEVLVERLANSPNIYEKDDQKVKYWMNKYLLEANQDDTYQKVIQEDLTENKLLLDTVKLYNPEFNIDEYNIEVNQESEAIFDVRGNVPEGNIFEAMTKITHGNKLILKSEYYNSEITLDRYSEPFVTAKSSSILKKYSQSTQEVESLNRAELKGFLNIRDAINSGFRSGEDFLELFKASRDFRTWKKETDLNFGLLASYNEKLREQPFSKSLKSKGLKFIVKKAVEGGAKMIEIQTGVPFAKWAAGLLYDKIVDSNFKPNSFIQGPYKGFVRHSMDR